MKYPIWVRFSEEARRAAATATYEIIVNDGKALLRADGFCCPLGVALNVDGPRPHYVGGLPWGSPGVGEVAVALGLLGDEERVAKRFIHDWDAGRVDPADLPALLGVAGAGAPGEGVA